MIIQNIPKKLPYISFDLLSLELALWASFENQLAMSINHVTWLVVLPTHF
jgi:hypothetical protein